MHDTYILSCTIYIYKCWVYTYILYLQGVVVGGYAQGSFGSNGGEWEGGGGHTIPMGKWVKVREREREREISFRESQKLGVIDRDWNVYNNIYGYTV